MNIRHTLKNLLILCFLVAHRSLLLWIISNGFEVKTCGKKAASAVAGAAAANAKREQKNREKLEYADKQTEQRSNEEEGFNNLTERAEFHKKRRYEWIEENGTVTKIIKNIEDWCDAF
jgi:hypothetical protein